MGALYHRRTGGGLHEAAEERGQSFAGKGLAQVPALTERAAELKKSIGL